MSLFISVIFTLICLLIIGVLLIALFFSKPISYLDLLEKLAIKHKGVICSIPFGRSVAEFPFSLGLVSVGVWPTSMLCTISMSTRANIRIQSTSFQEIPDFEIYGKFRLFSMPAPSGFKKVQLTESYADRDFCQHWHIYIKSETTTQDVDTLLKKFQQPITDLSRQALNPRWNVVNIFCQGKNIDFVYSQPAYRIETLETFVKTSVKFVQSLV
jgi:hypothetical protein